MTQCHDIEGYTFRPPLPRTLPSTKTTTFAMGKRDFLKAVEYVAPQLKDRASGQHWTYDGYQQTALYLVRPALPQLGLPAHGVEFELNFGHHRVTVAITSDSTPVLDLYDSFVREFALFMGLERHLVETGRS